MPVDRKVKSFTLQSGSVTTNGKIIINSIRPLQLQLVNTAGAIVWKGQLNGGNQAIDAGRLLPGMYFLTDGLTTERIIIQ